MRHEKSWETCDQCGKVIEKERISLELGSKEIELAGRVEVNPDGYFKQCSRIWLKAKGVFCSASCATKQFNNLIKEYIRAIDSKVDNLTTDLWGGAGPDCRTMPALAGVTSTITLSEEV